ncbi:MAG TPA: hypothetical protein VFV23_10770 [Verrucomicrobiae bacterium]|nr:hypothetical protein [Verrucomicrobiae bacterium]
MYPLRLIAMLEQVDPSFRDLFYPQKLRCPLEKRIVRAIEEHWPVFFPTQKDYRGSNWSGTLPENKPLYRPHPESERKLAQWKKNIEGTIAEFRAYRADVSWTRFITICAAIPRLRYLLNDFKPLADFLINEESFWPNHGRAVREDDYFKGQMQAVFSPNSPYRFSDPKRLQLLESDKSVREKILMIWLMHQLLDRPLMILAILQQCAKNEGYWLFWLPIQNHIAAIVKMPTPLTFRKTWLEHAMQVSGAIKKSGKSCPRKWARMLVSKQDQDLNLINAKAVEINNWLKGKKQPSMENIRRAGRIIFNSSRLNSTQMEAGKDLWLFSWMITLWLEKHFKEITAGFKGDERKIKTYYRRFFQYLKNNQLAHKD